MPTPQSYEKLHTISDVEIFRAGKWNNDTYSVADLDDMVEAFGRVGYRPPIKLGHESKSGDRAWGWVSGLRRVGTKLLADFAAIPESLYKLIKDRAFDSRSAEIYWDIERNGKKFRRALKAVALLGVETPAVNDLTPLADMLTTFNDFFGATSKLCVMHGLRIEGQNYGADEDEDEEPGSAESELTAIIWSARHLYPRAKTDDEALALAAADDPDLADEIAELQKLGGKETMTTQHADPSEELTAIGRRIMSRNPKITDFGAAFDYIKVTDPALGRRVTELQQQRLDNHRAGVYDSPVSAASKMASFSQQQRPDDNRATQLQIDTLAKAHMTKTGEKDYVSAVSAILRDPAYATLAQKYVASRRG